MARIKFVSRSGTQIGIGAGAMIYERYVVHEGQTQVRLLAHYSPGIHQLYVYRNGVVQEIGVHYIEVDSNTVEFLKPLTEGDSILLTVQGVYSTRLHEEYIAGDTQDVFTLNNSYHPGLLTLQVFRNGILQRQGTDYAETDEHTVTLTIPCTDGEILIFHEVV